MWGQQSPKHPGGTQAYMGLPHAKDQAGPRYGGGVVVYRTEIPRDLMGGVTLRLQITRCC